jgi:hypothetical protein
MWSYGFEMMFACSDVRFLRTCHDDNYNVCGLTLFSSCINTRFVVCQHLNLEKNDGGVMPSP